MALVRRGRHTDPARKKIAEAPQAVEADLHADLGDRMLAPRQQEFGLVQSRLNPKLVRREPEQRLKLPDEVERRDPHFSRDVPDREPLLPHLRQQLPRPAKTAKSIVAEQHDITREISNLAATIG